MNAKVAVAEPTYYTVTLSGLTRQELKDLATVTASRYRVPRLLAGEAVTLHVPETDEGRRLSSLLGSIDCAIREATR